MPLPSWPSSCWRSRLDLDVELEVTLGRAHVHDGLRLVHLDADIEAQGNESREELADRAKEVAHDSHLSYRTDYAC